MARVLVNMPSQYGGKQSGVARVAFSLLKRLALRDDHQYWLRSNWTNDTLPVDLPQDKIGVIHIPRPQIMILDVIRQLISIPHLCRELGIDIVWNVDPFGAARGGKARVTTIHDLYYRTVPELIGIRSAWTMALCTRTVLAGSTRIVAISEATRADVVATYPWTASVVLTIVNDSTIKCSCLTNSVLPEGTGRYALLVGNATPNKNFGVAVSALSNWPHSGEPLTLVHVGQDEHGMIDNAMKSVLQPPKLIRLNDIDDAVLANIYMGAECLLVTSISEGFCLPIIEAQSLGCPVIASSLSAMPEVAGVGALYFNPHDPTDLRARIRELDLSSVLRSELVQLGKQNRMRFSWDNAAESYAKLFGSLA